MKSWAAIAAGPGRLGRQDHANSRSEFEQAERAQTSESGPQDVLLAEALKSRPSVTGERRCLACGRAFRDLPRFAQHIKDAHGGVNASGASPILASTSGRGAYGGGAPRPGPRAAVQLRDVLLGSMPPPMTGPQASSKQQLHRQARHAQQARQAAQHPGTAGGRAAPVALAAGTHVSRAAAASFAPPPGTRQRKQNKRESRLKRAFRRSQAMLACERWQGVLAELEAALQGLAEAQGCLANQQAWVARQLAAAVSPPGTAIDWASPQEALRQQEERQLARANLDVTSQLLEQQRRHAEECREKLEGAHEQARIRLTSAQRQLQKLDRLPVQEAAHAGAAPRDAGDAASQPASPPEETSGAATQAATAGLAAGDVRLPGAAQELPSAAGPAGAARSTASSGGWLPGNVSLCLGTAEPVADAGEQAEEQVDGQASKATDGATGAGEADARREVAAGAWAGDAASEAASSSLASFGFQDVLSGWAASNRHLAALPHLASGPAQVARHAAATACGAPSRSLADGHTPRAAAPPAKAAQHRHESAPPVAVLQGGLGPAADADGPAQPSRATLPDAQAMPAGTGCDAEPPSSSSSESSSDGSFGLQWGDQLLAWASSVRADAAEVARLATLGGQQQAQQAAQPQQRQQQEAPPLLGRQPATAGEGGAVQDLAAVRPPTPVEGAGGDSTSQQAVPLGLAGPQPPALPEALPENSLQAQQPERQQPAVVASQQLPAALRADVAAWLSSTTEAAQPADALGAALPPPTAASDSDVASLIGSTVAASAGAGAAGVAAAVRDSGWEQQPDERDQQPAYVQPAAGAIGAFRCLLCQLTVSGQRNLQEHLASKRHVRRVAAQAAAAAHAAAGPEAAHALEHAGSARAVAAAGNRGGAAAVGLPRTYTGLGADVEPYVDQVITPQLNGLAEAMLRRLLEWQERARLADPVNFKRKRRLVSGMREVEKAIKTRKAKLVLLAPNIGSIVADQAAAASAADGSDGAETGAGSTAAGGAGGAATGEYPAQALIALAAEKDVPLVFALSRQRMGKVMGQRKRASAFAVLDANGVFEELRKLLVLAEEGRRAWAAAQPTAAAALTSGPA